MHGQWKSMNIECRTVNFSEQDTADDAGAEELTVANVGGVFAVLISGAGVGIIVSIFESVLDVRNRASELEVRPEIYPANNLFTHQIFSGSILRRAD